MASKKIVFIIVEGPSDDEALGVIFHRLYSSNEVHVEITHGDMTSDDAVGPENIEEKINELIERYAGHTFQPDDFKEVIHLVDMDGAFVPDDCVVFDSGAAKTYYKRTEICTDDCRKIRVRNAHKKANMTRLYACGAVWGSVSYRCYYMSCNLDHVLHDKQNCADREKQDKAFQFAERYKDDLDGFLSFICDSSFSRIGDFVESWEYIKQGTHSLERNTNLGICLAGVREARWRGA